MSIRYSIVIPVYRNEESLPELIRRIVELEIRDLEVVFVVDGSPDRSHEMLQRLLPTAPLHAQLIRLSRNFGAFSAIRSGLAAARGEFIAVMAADLQEPPELVRDFFRTLESGETDIVVGRRASRSDPLLSRLSSALYWRAYRMAVQPDIPEGGVDVFGCTSRVRDVLVSLEEQNTSLLGLLFWVGFSRELVPYDRLARPHGKSAWTLSRKLRYMSDSIFAFSDLPIRLITLVGIIGVVTSLIVGLVVFGFWAAGRIEVRGYTPMILSIFFIGMLQLVSIGIIGSYVFRTYENTKGRPRYIVASQQEFDPDK